MAAVSDPASSAASPGFRLPEVFGLRVLNRIGGERLARFAVAAVFIGLVVTTIVVLRPDLAHQTEIGTDSSNYYAAGQRLNDGHPLYQLSPGDRPVPLNPPFWTVPILSPPFMSVVWRPLAMLGDSSMVLWWLAGIAAIAATTLWMVAHGSRRRLVIVAVISMFLAEALWSGNVNPFIICTVIGVWAATARGHSTAAGVLVAIGAGLKLTPVYLAWWFVVRGDRPALKGFVVGGVAVAAISLLGAGLENHFEYLRVMRETAGGGVTPWSVAGFLSNSGVPAEVASLATFGWTILAGAVVWLLRSRPRASFVAAVLMVLYSSPVVLLGNLAMLLAVTAPFPAPGRGGMARTSLDGALARIASRLPWREAPTPTAGQPAP